MTDAITRYAEAAYALLVAGVATLGCVLFGPAGSCLALIVAAGYLIALAAIADRRTPTPGAPE